MSRSRSVARPVPTRDLARRSFAATLATAAVLAALGTAAATNARAGTLAITVEGADGQPAANVVVQLVPSAAYTNHASAEPVVILQKDIRFVPWITAVPVGSTVRFTNGDRFDHHIRSQPGGPLGTLPPAKEFEFRIPGAKGDKVSSADVRLDAPGTIVLGCHLHNSMRGHLYVSSTPFVAVTDAQGRAVIADAPDGDATVKVWHPEQLVDQPDAKAALKGGSTAFAATLNFTPRKKPAAAEKKPAYSY